MKSTQLINSRVKHGAFGEGVITQVSGSYLTIKFASKVARFIYPDSFEKFIWAKDASLQAVLMEEIHKAKQAVREKHEALETARKAEEERCAAEKRTAPKTRNRRRIEEGFRPDYNVKYLAKQPILTYQQVEEQFGVRIAGFGRGVSRTSTTVVLVSPVDKKKAGFVYQDHWTSDGDYIYSGKGKTGDQGITPANKAIVEAERDGKSIHLFVKFSSREYYYQGPFALVDYTNEDIQDESGNVRKEYKFRLRKQPTEG